MKWRTEVENEEYVKRLGFSVDNYFNRSNLNRKINVIYSRNVKYLNDYEPKFPEDVLLSFFLYLISNLKIFKIKDDNWIKFKLCICFDYESSYFFH